jgi:hypothetical protein
MRRDDVAPVARDPDAGLVVTKLNERWLREAFVASRSNRREPWQHDEEVAK